MTGRYVVRSAVTGYVALIAALWMSRCLQSLIWFRRSVRVARLYTTFHEQDLRHEGEITVRFDACP